MPKKEIQFSSFIKLYERFIRSKYTKFSLFWCSVTLESNPLHTMRKIQDLKSAIFPMPLFNYLKCDIVTMVLSRKLEQCLIFTKKDKFLENKDNTNFTSPYSNPPLIAFHQNTWFKPPPSPNPNLAIKMQMNYFFLKERSWTEGGDSFEKGEEFFVLTWILF